MIRVAPDQPFKKNNNYLNRKGYSIFDASGQKVNPDSVNWSSYEKGIPFKVVQPGGDANSLGIMKFNFPNKYSVYLHDTNQRSLFNNSFRSFIISPVSLVSRFKLSKISDFFS